MECTRHRYRWIVWPPRGVATGPFPFGLMDQVADVERILQVEGIQRCHLLAWCTGPKVAIEFYLRHPESVLRMVFLNATFKCTGSPKELDTEYERDLESLCFGLKEQPAMADAIRAGIVSSLSDNELDGVSELDQQRLAAGALALMHPHLRKCVLGAISRQNDHP